MREKHAKPEATDVASALTASGLIDGIDDWEALKPSVRQVNEGQFVCKTGDEARCLWVVLSGEVAVQSGGRTITKRGRGHVVGEQALLDSTTRRTADLMALGGQAELLEIGRGAIEAHPQQPRIWKNCAAVISTKLKEATQQRHALHDKLMDREALLRRYVGDRALSEKRLWPDTFFNEYRQETAVIWFSDVSGFSKQAVGMPPQRVADFVQRFLGVQVEAIEAENGYVDKFVGDLVMAYWIVPGDGRADCEQALRAALRSLAEIQLIEVGTVRLAARIGLHIGSVSTGNFGTVNRSQYTLIGTDVNKAARLEQVRDEDVNEEGGRLGWIRVSREFFDLLAPATQRHLPNSVHVTAKNMGIFEVRSSAPV